jgi:hypothetical protein
MEQAKQFLNPPALNAVASQLIAALTEKAASPADDISKATMLTITKTATLRNPGLRKAAKLYGGADAATQRKLQALATASDDKPLLETLADVDVTDTSIFSVDPAKLEANLARARAILLDVNEETWHLKGATPA